MKIWLVSLSDGYREKNESYSRIISQHFHISTFPHFNVQKVLYYYYYNNDDKETRTTRSFQEYWEAIR